MYDQALIEDLNQKARHLRRNIVLSIDIGRAGHLGGSCSAADLVAALYFHKMHHDPKNPEMRDRDRVIFSKGHAALAQYAALAQCGYFPESELPKTKTLGAMLQGHPDFLKTPGIEAGTGSLGQGLSIALGMALGMRLNKIENRKCYAIVGDGELEEGQIWEAAMAAASFKVDNLVALVDRNRLQASDKTENIINIGDMAGKWRSFGWEVLEIDGHDMAAILEALDKADTIKDKPTVIIASTVKGKGVSFAENQVGFHNSALTKEQYDQALSELQ